MKPRQLVDRKNIPVPTVLAALFITGICVAIIFPLAARADVGDLVTGDTSLSLNRDATSGKRGLSYDANVAVAFVNLGLSARAWDGAITGWNGRRISDEATFYAGVGLLDLFIVQRGFSSTGARTRIRALVGLGKNFPLPGDARGQGVFTHGIVLSPFIETGGGKRVYGVGLVFYMAP